MTFLENVDLQPYNTFGIKVKARYFITLRSAEEISGLLMNDLFKRQRHLFLGGGSNVLFTKDFDGIIAHVQVIGTRTVKEDDDFIEIEVGAGTNWHELVQHCVANDWGGIENLSLIPGTAGAAPMQNIGAYGVEIRQVITSVSAVEISTGHQRTFDNAACQFGYRDSIFKGEAKGRYVISSVTLRLTKRNHQLVTHYGTINEELRQQGDQPLTIGRISDAVISIRRSKLPDPAQIGNAGSFFKNPSIDTALYDLIQQAHPTVPAYPAGESQVKVPAGWLIEQCGWKGKQVGNIGVHRQQALVLVNYGGGSGNDLWQLAMDIRASVNEKFGIILQPEVNIID
jgi:UDP-N-acetylmuramate dehydrogenase